MNLFTRIVRRLAIVLVLLMTLWAALFYYAMVDEIRDEADDALEDYSALIISRVLAGRELPQSGDGSNNTYTLMPISQQEAAQRPRLEYFDENVYITSKREEEPARVVVTIFEDAKGNYYELRVATPTFEKEDLFESVLIWIVVLYVGLLAVVLGVTMLIFYGGMRPLYDLLHWLDDYIPGSKPKPVPSGGEVEEFSRLGNALQRAIDRSEETFERQAQFIGDASHELQTPLAVIGNRVEWLLDNPALTEEQAAELFKIEKTLSHAVRLNKTLLLLTKIDNHQFPESTDVNMVELIEECVENYGEVYSSRSVDFSCDLPASYTLHINPSLAATLVNNLVKNAYVHSLAGAVAAVTLQGDELMVSNTGEAALDADHIFDRFYQGQRKSGSTGLGLALVAAVCRYYNMGITYRFEGGRHNFCVKLK